MTNKEFFEKFRELPILDKDGNLTTLSDRYYEPVLQFSHQCNCWEIYYLDSEFECFQYWSQSTPEEVLDEAYNWAVYKGFIKLQPHELDDFKED